MDRDSAAASPLGSRLLGNPDQSVRSIRIRTQLLLSTMLISTNLIGVGLVVVISLFVTTAPDMNDALWLALVIAVPTYVVVAVAFAAAVGTVGVLRAIRWLRTGSEPTSKDRQAVLEIPTRLTVLQATLWVTASVFFSVLAAIMQPSRALTTFLTIFIAGAVATGIAFLLAEFAMRPLAARALMGAPFVERPRLAGVGSRMVIFWVMGSGIPVAGLMLSALLTLTGRETSATRLSIVALVVGGVVLVFGSFVTVLNARSFVQPVVSVGNAMRAIGEGDLDTKVIVYNGTELGLLQSGFNEMAEGLRERARIQDLFGRHVGVEVARAATEDDDNDLGGISCHVSVLFVDLIGSTSYATDNDPEEVVATLNRFFAVVVDEVNAQEGLINKFLGDAVLAVFGAPKRLADHQGAALAAARRIKRRLDKEVPEIGAGIGVADGEAVAGNVGHQYRFEYTVIGDAVNTAARLSELAKETEGGMVVTWDAVRAAKNSERAHWSPQGTTVLRGRRSPTPLGVMKRSKD